MKPEHIKAIETSVCRNCIEFKTTPCADYFKQICKQVQGAIKLLDDEDFDQRTIHEPDIQIREEPRCT